MVSTPGLSLLSALASVTPKSQGKAAKKNSPSPPNTPTKPLQKSHKKKTFNPSDQAGNTTETNATVEPNKEEVTVDTWKECVANSTRYGRVKPRPEPLSLPLPQPMGLPVVQPVVQMPEVSPVVQPAQPTVKQQSAAKPIVKRKRKPKTTPAPRKAAKTSAQSSQSVQSSHQSSPQVHQDSPPVPELSLPVTPATPRPQVPPPSPQVPQLPTHGYTSHSSALHLDAALQGLSLREFDPRQIDQSNSLLPRQNGVYIGWTGTQYGLLSQPSSPSALPHSQPCRRVPPEINSHSGFYHPVSGQLVYVHRNAVGQMGLADATTTLPPGVLADPFGLPAEWATE